MLRILADTKRSTKKAIAVVYDLVTIWVSLYAAICLRLSTFDINVRAIDLIAWGVAPAIAVLIFAKLGLYRTVIRYATYRAFLCILLGLAASSFALITASFFFHTFIPRSVPGIFFFISLVFVSLPRLAIRNLVNIFKPANSIPVLIYGAGSSALQLASSLRTDRAYYPAAFIDDDPAQAGNSYDGVPVFPLSEIETLIRERGVQRVFIATHQESKQERLRVVRSLEPYPVRVQTIPALGDLIAGEARIDDIHDIDISDLLGRDPVAPDVDLMQEHIANKSVLVTGAGGSIGSELCKQIVAYAPSRLVLFECGEYNLYQAYEQLQSLCANKKLEVTILPVLGNVQNGPLMDAVIREQAVDTIYHAAAYKHVPIVESNAFEGVHNNLFGTLTCVQAAISNKVSTFVLVSTDKAVRPTNIMGATKRLAELCLQALADQEHDTTLCMVRFGNVLNSSGSVVPKFREQIQRGGPVTVTHPDITRYFMTTEEAAQLVIQAGALATGGEVFVLEMGEPVKILDLAKEMVLLSGLTLKNEQNPSGDIEIRYTGLRPGEKLFEELLIGGNCEATRHSRIRKAKEFALSWDELSELLDQLRVVCAARDPESLQEVLMTCPIAYGPIEPLPSKRKDAKRAAKQPAQLQVISSN